MKRRKMGDWMIRAGLALQVVFLFFVDWGTVAGMLDAEELPWGHIIGLFAVNVVLLASAVMAWSWMKRVQNAPASDRSR